MTKTLILDIDNTLIEAMKESFSPAAKRHCVDGWLPDIGWCLPAARTPARLTI